MNTTLTPRLFSLVLSTLITAAMLYSIDTLASKDLAATSLMAQASADAVRPL